MLKTKRIIALFVCIIVASISMPATANNEFDQQNSSNECISCEHAHEVAAVAVTEHEDDSETILAVCLFGHSMVLINSGPASGAPCYYSNCGITTDLKAYLYKCSKCGFNDGYVVCWYHPLPY